jgi:hypothetical protein
MKLNAQKVMEYSNLKKIMKYKMPYDDYVMGETQLNCDNQNILAGYGFYIYAYKERILHELKWQRKMKNKK